MTAKKRDQPHHNLVQQYLPGLILSTIPGIIRELGDQYNAKPGLGGMAAYQPTVMAAVCIMLEAERTTCRKMVGMLRNNYAMLAKMYGDCTRCCRLNNRARGIPICAACCNIELVVRPQVKDGRHTPNQIATLVVYRRVWHRAHPSEASATCL